MRPQLALLALLALAACENATPDAPVARWTCPTGWVPYARGGCGPAVVLCAPDGGAASGACNDVNIAQPVALASGDGGAAPGFWRAPDGSIRGAWREPGEPDGPPREDWTPDVGTTCPQGWQRTDEDTCEPTLTECPSGSASLPGGACTPRESECPPAGTEYPTPPPEAASERIFYLRAGAMSDGADGTRERPFPTLALAIAAAQRGPARTTWLLLADGTYTGRTIIGNPGGTFHVLGTCAARVTLATDTTDYILVTGNAATRITLQDVTFRGSLSPVRAESRSAITLRRVALRDVAAVAITALTEGRVELDTVWIDNVRRNSATGGGHGIWALRGGQITARRVHFSRVQSNALFTEGAGTRATLADSVVVAPVIAGVFAQAGSEARVERSVVFDAYAAGLVSEGEGARVAAEEVLVRFRGARADPGDGVVAQGHGAIEARRLWVLGAPSSGCRAIGAGTLDVRRSVLLRNARAAVLADGEGSAATLEDVWARDSTGARRTPADLELGYGVHAQEQAVITGTRVRVDRARGSGVNASHTASRVTLAESVIAGTRLGEFHVGGRSIVSATAAFANGTSTLSLTRVLLVDNADHGVLALDAGTSATLDRCAVVRTLGRAGAAPSESYGRGVVAVTGASVRVTGSVLRANQQVAGIATLDGTLRVEDSLIAGEPRSATTPRGFGMGLQPLHGSTLEATRVLIEGVRHVGVFAMGGRDTELDERGGAPRVTLRDVWVRDIRQSDPAGYGLGVAALGEAMVQGERVFVEDVAGIGVVALGDEAPGMPTLTGAVTLTDVFVRGVRASSFERYLSADHRPIAHGVEARGGSRLALRRAVVEGADWGVFHRDATLDLRDAVIVRQRVGAGALNGRGVTLERVNTVGNPAGMVRDVRLPEGGIPPPLPPCADPPYCL